MSSPLVLSPRHSTTSSPVLGSFDGNRDHRRSPATIALSQEYVARSRPATAQPGGTQTGVASLAEPSALILGASRRSLSNNAASYTTSTSHSGVGKSGTTATATAGRKRPPQAQRRAMGQTSAYVYTPLSPTLQAAKSPSIPCTPLLLDPSDPFANAAIHGHAHGHGYGYGGYGYAHGHGGSLLNLAAAGTVPTGTSSGGGAPAHLVGAALARAVDRARPPSSTTSTSSTGGSVPATFNDGRYRRRSSLLVPAAGSAGTDDASEQNDGAEGATTPTESAKVAVQNASPSRRLYSSVAAGAAAAGGSTTGPSQTA